MILDAKLFTISCKGSAGDGKEKYEYIYKLIFNIVDSLCIDLFLRKI